MKNPTIKLTRTKSKIARLRVRFEIQFSQRDPEAAEKAWATLGNVLREVLQTPEARETFLAEFHRVLDECKKEAGV